MPNPEVTHTSTRAILWVMVEVCVFTALLGWRCCLPGLVTNRASGVQLDFKWMRQGILAFGLHVALHGAVFATGTMGDLTGKTSGSS